MNLPKLPSIDTKSKFFKLSFSFLVIILLSVSFIPKDTWNKIFSGNIYAFAAVFQTGTSGNWNATSTWGTTAGTDTFLNVNNINFSSLGKLYISDTSNNRIIVLNQNGSFNAIYPTGTSTLFNHVAGLDISSSSGYIYATNIFGSKIVVLNPDGSASTTISGVSHPEDVKFSPNGDIYIADSGNQRILVLNPDGSASTTISGSIFSPTLSPFYLAFSPSGYLYVTGAQDMIENSIFVINPNGTASTSYSVGTTSDVIKGLTFSPSGNIYVADFTQNAILLLNPNGTASTTYNGDTFSPLNNPADVKLSASGDIYIADDSNQRVVVLNPNGTASTTYSTFPLLPLREGIDYPGMDDDATINTGTVILTQDQNVHSLTLATGGTLNLNGHTLNVAGDWRNSGGTLIDNSTSSAGTVNLIGTSTQTIFGTNTFPNLTRSSTTTTSLLFDTNATTTIIGNLFLSGTSDNLLSIAPNSGSVAPIFDRIIASSELAFTNPTGVGADSSGNIYIASNGLPSILKFSSSGSFISSFSTTTTGNISDMRQIAVSTSSVYAVNSSLIWKFDLSGNFLASSSVVASGANSIAVDNSGIIYVLSNDNEVVKIDPSDFSIINSTTSINGVPAAFQFDNDAGIAVNQAGNLVYVTDTDHSRIVVLNSSDLSTVSVNPGPPDVPFVFPTSLVVDSSGNIYVSNYNDKIIKVAPDFSLLTQWGTSGSGAGQFDYPEQITLDSSGNIYVVEVGNQRVQKFTPPSFSPFHIIHTGSSTTAVFSFLNVFGSINLSSDIFDCTNGCVNGGSNINWVFPAAGIPPHRRTISSTIVSSIIAASTSIPYNSSTTISWTSTNASDCHVNKTGYVSTNGSSWGSGTFGTTSSGNLTSTTTFDLVCTRTGYMGVSTDSTVVYVFQNSTSTSTSSSTPSGTSATTSSSTSPTTPSASSSLPAKFAFCKNLPEYTTCGLNAGGYIGACISVVKTDIDVKYLEIFLNNNGFPLASSGFGSIGQETEYYGGLTKQAVSKFQQYYSILNPYGNPTGYFDTATRHKVNQILGVPAECPSMPSTPGRPSPVIPSGVSSNLGGSGSSGGTGGAGPGTSGGTSGGSGSSGGIGGIKGLSTSLGDFVKPIGDIVESPVGALTARIAAAVGLIVGAFAYVTALLFSNPIMFSEIWTVPARLFGLLMQALGLRKKQRPWGTVYDSITKRPLDPAYVTLIDEATGKEVASAITDLDGRYGFLVQPGKYKIVAQKTNYDYPSFRMEGKSFDEVYGDIYFGTDLTITHEGETITKNIPMDPQKFDWNEFTKNKGNMNTFIKGTSVVWAKISKIMFIIGAIISLVSLIFAPAPYNIIIFGLYVVAYVLNFIVFETKKAGTLMDKATGLPLSFAVVKIFREGDESPITKKIADKYGRYYSLVPKGRYSLKIDKKNDDESYTEVLKTDVFEAKKGMINGDYAI